MQTEEKCRRKKFNLKNEHNNNPCLKEHKLSLKCLSDNDFNKDACYEYFENYNECKRFWGKIQHQRRISGVLPHLPPPEEREKIKSQYLEELKVS